MKRHLAIYVEEAEFARLKAEAARRRVSISRWAHEQLTKEISIEAREAGGRPGHAEIEALASGLHKAVREALKPLSQQVGILTAMLDRFVMTMLINTPELAEGKKEQMATAAERRYRGWERAVQELVEGMYAEIRKEPSLNQNGAPMRAGAEA